MDRFFWGSNTGRGFVSYAEEFYPEARRRILIKGGPGTGKSSFLKKVAEATKEPVLFHCASSPNSLDAVADFSLGYFITDATAPHVLEPVLPGARDEILDFGKFWQKEKLRERIISIVKCQQKTTDFFTLAYASLAKALKIRERLEKEYPVQDLVQFKKIWQEMYNRITPNYPNLGRGEKRFISAYTPQGLKRMPLIAKETLYVGASPSYAETLLYPLAALFLGSGDDVLYLMDPLDGHKLEGLYIQSRQIYIEAKWTYGESELASFVQQATEEGFKALNNAFQAHEDLEKLYIEAMDFPALNEYLGGVLADIVGAD